MKKKLIAFSGGIGSFWAAKLMVDTYGSENVVAIFTDVNWEDEDLYTFIHDAINHLEIDLIYLQAPYNPLELSILEKCLYNSRMASCSRILKMRLQYSFILERKYQVLGKRFDMEDMIVSGIEYQKSVITPDTFDIVLGIDWTESNRTKAIKDKWGKYNFEVLFPLVEDISYSKEVVFRYLKENEINIPRLYKMGFSHNNCGGRCFKAGQAHFKLLLENFPDRFEQLKRHETDFNFTRNEKHSFLTKQRNNQKLRYTLAELEKDITSFRQIDLFDFGGCGCFVDDLEIEEVFK